LTREIAERTISPFRTTPAIGAVVDLASREAQGIPSMERIAAHSNPAVHRGLVALVCLIAIVAGGCEMPGLDDAEASRDASVAPEITQEAKLERGHYLVTIGGCNDCHTPWVMGANGPGPDMTRTLSGHPEDVPITVVPAASTDPAWGWAGAATNTAFAGPWGVSFAFNLTPDENTGIGIWTEEMFVQALRSGKHMGQSRPILPPMPWFNYGKMTDEDLSAVYAYLRSIPPVQNRVPDPLPPATAPVAGVPAGG
jgi:mono/diheme cytochrome c family protein